MAFGSKFSELKIFSKITKWLSISFYNVVKANLKYISFSKILIFYFLLINSTFFGHSIILCKLSFNHNREHPIKVVENFESSRIIFIKLLYPRDSSTNSLLEVVFVVVTFPICFSRENGSLQFKHNISF